MKLPQAAAGVQDQLTPWVSFVTVATTLAVPRTSIDEGGGVLSVTEMPDAALMVIWAEADFVPSAAEVAVMVTGLVAGTVAGAV